MKDSIISWVKSNRIKIFFILIVVSIIMLLYVDNTIKINSLLREIQIKENMISDVKAKNEILKSKIIELESADRITKIAEEKLNLAKPNKVPQVINDNKKE
jgi:cell division protein FtsL